MARSANLRTAATLCRVAVIESDSPTYHSEFHQEKTHTQSPETDCTTPYEFPGSKKFHEAAERALDHYLKPRSGARLWRFNRS